MTRWTGALRRDGDGITGELIDVFGFVTTITGTRSATGYDLTAELTHVPDAYTLPGDAEAEHTVKRTPMGKKIPPPKPGVSKMNGDYCPDCHATHGGEACGWDAGKPCPDCGRPIGGKTKHMTGLRCVLCEIEAGNPT